MLETFIQLDFYIAATALLHISCVAAVLIQIVLLNPKSDQITEKLVCYKCTKIFYLNITKIITVTFLLCYFHLIQIILGIINYEISTCISKCSRVVYVLTYQMFEESPSRYGNSINFLCPWKPRLFNSSLFWPICSSESVLCQHFKPTL